MTPHVHIADAIKMPSVIRLGNNIFALRFETMKVVSALRAVEDLVHAGTLKQGDTLLDCSSGVYAYALALACHKHGMRCHIVASKSIDASLIVQLRILGVKVEQVEAPAGANLDHAMRVRRVQQIMMQNPEMHWMRQYHDRIHYLGYEAVSEIVQSFIPNQEIVLVGSVGSGCSTGGIATALRRNRPNTELVAIQPFGSMTFGAQSLVDPGAVIPGLGSAIPFDNVEHELYDRIHWISFDLGAHASVALLREHAIFAGLSSGCNYLAASYEARESKEKAVVFLIADTGHRYVESVFARHDAFDRKFPDSPKKIKNLSELSLPWSVIQWNRQSMNPD